MGVTLELGRPVTDLAAELRDGGFDAAFLAVGAQLGKRDRHPGRRLRPHPRRARRAARRRRRANAAARPPRRRLRRRRHRDGRRPHRPAHRRHRRHHRLPAHPRTDAGPPGRARRGGGRGHHRALAVDDRLRRRRARSRSRRMRLDETGHPQPTGEFETLPADSVVLAIGQDSDLALLDGLPDIERRRRAGRGRAAPGDRPPRRVRRRRHRRRPAHRDRRDRPRHARRAPIDAYLRARPTAGRRRRRRPTAERLPPGTTATPRPRVRPQLEAARRVTPSTRWSPA